MRKVRSKKPTVGQTRLPRGFGQTDPVAEALRLKHLGQSRPEQPELALLGREERASQ